MKRLPQMLLALLLGALIAGFAVALDRTADLQAQLDEERARINNMEGVMIEIQRGELVIETPTPTSA